MGKDTKGAIHADTFKRINFLYQAAHAALKATPSNLELVRFYATSVKAIARKAVLRLDPSIKRTLCKKCFMLLIPGVTSSIRIKAKRQRHMSIRCMECGTTKRFILDPEHSLWSEQKEAWQSLVPKHVLDQLEEKERTTSGSAVTGTTEQSPLNQASSSTTESNHHSENNTTSSSEKRKNKTQPDPDTLRNINGIDPDNGLDNVGKINGTVNCVEKMELCTSDIKELKDHIT